MNKVLGDGPVFVDSDAEPVEYSFSTSSATMLNIYAWPACAEELGPVGVAARNGSNAKVGETNWWW